MSLFPVAFLCVVPGLVLRCVSLHLRHDEDVGKRGGSDQVVLPELQLTASELGTDSKETFLDREEAAMANQVVESGCPRGEVWENRRGVFVAWLLG